MSKELPTYEEVYDYYIIQNHRRSDSASYFNMNEGDFRKLLWSLGIRKDKKLSTKNSQETLKDVYGDPIKLKEINEKREATCFERFGAKSNLLSNDPKVNGEATRLEKYGHVHYCNWEKSKKTKFEKYGEYWVNSDKAKQTSLEKYGEIHKNCLQENKEKIKNTQTELYGGYAWNSAELKRKNGTFTTSRPEEGLYSELCNEYGEDNVIREYTDERYKNPYTGYLFNCDFYIKSKDLFIELNKFPTHYIEPFDNSNIEHIKLLEHCKNEPSSWVEEQMVDIWAGTDVLKKSVAEQNKLNWIAIY